MTAHLDAVLAVNEDFAKAYVALEPWALQHAQEILGLDGQASRVFPERTAQEDGKPHNWCGTCIHGGCVCCDLPGNHEAWKEHQTRLGE